MAPPDPLRAISTVNKVAPDMREGAKAIRIEEKPLAQARLNWRVMLPVFIIVSLDAASAGAVLPILPFYLRELGATVLLGLTAVNFSAAAAYAADNSTPTNRRQAIGVLSAGLGLGGIIGPGISGYLTDLALTAPIWLSLILTATSIAVTAFWVNDANPSSQIDRPAQDTGVHDRVSFRSIVRAPAVRVLIVVLLCHYFSYGLFTSEFAVFLGDTFTWDGHAFGPKELSYLLVADGVINIVVQLFLLKKISDVFTERNLVVAIFCVLSLGYLAAGLATQIPALAFAVLCISTGVALARPTFMAALSVQVARERQGVVMGAIQSLVAVTDVVSPVTAGFILGLGLYQAWIATVLAIALTGTLVAYTCLPRRRP